MRKILPSLIAGCCAFVVTGCNVKYFMMRKAVEQQVDYFHTPASSGQVLTQLTGRVWTYNDRFDRTLIVDTSEGLVVVDPFSSRFTTGLNAALRRHNLTKPVHTLIYSHYHLDHVRGGSLLAPRHVVAHERCPEYWKDVGSGDILAPTDFIRDDTDLQIGDVTIKLLYLGHSHTDTNFAVYVPDEGVLYAADMVGVRVFLPLGGISLYSPGYFRALDRLGQVPFRTFVSSHFGWGTRQDFLDAAQLQRDIRDHVRAAMRRHAGPYEAFMDRKRLTAMFEEVHDALKAKYGSWHGFDSQLLPSFFSAYANEVVGN